MKFQPYKVAWKEKPKPIVLQPKAKEITQEVVTETKENVVKMQEVIVQKEAVQKEEVSQELIMPEEETKEIFRPKTFKDYMIITLIVIIFLLFLWNLYSMNEMKRLYQTQEKILNVLLDHLLKE